MSIPILMNTPVKFIARRGGVATCRALPWSGALLWSAALILLAAPAVWAQAPGTAVGPPAGAASRPPAGPPPGPPQLGSINYLEGQASIDGMPLAPNSVGFRTLGKDQTLTTQAGKVEVLLTPGVFLRVADNSSVKMISPDLANTRVQLEKGRAIVEVLDIHSQNDIQIEQNGATTKVLKNGLYDFDADHATVRVFDGKAETTVGNQKTSIGGKHELALNASGKLKSKGFDPNSSSQDDFYRWNSLRSGYLSEASVSAARAYMGPGPEAYGPGWGGYGWYWDPYFSVYTFLPGGGIFYDPFGFGFYSPFAVYRSPYFYHPGIVHGFGQFHYPYGHGIGRVGGFRGGGFHGGGVRGGGRR